MQGALQNLRPAMPYRYLSCCWWFGRNSLSESPLFPLPKLTYCLQFTHLAAWPGCRVQPYSGQMEVCCASSPFCCLFKLAGSDFQRRQSLTSARWPRKVTTTSSTFYLQYVIWCLQKWGRTTSWPSTSAGKGSYAQHKMSAAYVIQADKQKTSYFKGYCSYLPRPRSACKCLCSMTVPGEGVPLALYRSQNARCTHKIHYCAWLGSACQGQSGYTLRQPPWGSPSTLFLVPFLEKASLRGAYGCQPAASPE